MNPKKSLFLAAVLVLAAVLSTGAAEMPQDKAGFKSLVGSWRGFCHVDFVITFHRDKTYAANLAVPGLTTGRGNWERTGLDTFRATDKAFYMDPETGVVLEQVTRADVTVIGDSFEAMLDVSLYAPDGTLVLHDVYPATAERIAIE